MARTIRYNWSLIQKAHDEGATWRELQSAFGVSLSSLAKAAKRGAFSPRSASEAWRVACEKGRKVVEKSARATKYNWPLIQKFHDEGGTWREARTAFGVTMGTLAKATKRGDFCPRNLSEAGRLARKKGRGRAFHTAATKAKMSKSRIRFLEANPDKNPYRLYHSSKKSYPEQRFEDALKAEGITGWIYAYQNSIYEYDFAFPGQKIDVEIDGRTHLMEHVQAIDRRRDAFSMSQGWAVLRFSASRVKHDVGGCIQELKDILAVRNTTELVT
jgi:very-short-patch-repair endonuclease